MVLVLVHKDLCFFFIVGNFLVPRKGNNTMDQRIILWPSHEDSKLPTVGDGFGSENLASDLKLLQLVTLPETNSSPPKIGLPKRKIVFQPSILRSYVSFREGTD